MRYVNKDKGEDRTPIQHPRGSQRRVDVLFRYSCLPEPGKNCRHKRTKRYVETYDEKNGEEFPIVIGV